VTAQGYIAKNIEEHSTGFNEKGFAAVAECLSWLGPILVSQMGDTIFPNIAEVVAMRESAQQAKA
jgi:hypothetical protein